MTRSPTAAWEDLTFDSTQVTSISRTFPSHLQDGDFVLGYFRVVENPGTVTYPSYITNLVADALFTAGTVDSRARLFWFRRDAVAQGATFTISWTTAQYCQLTLFGFRGVDPTTPFGTLPQNNQTTGSVNGGSSFPFNSVSVSAGQLACLIGLLQGDAVDEGTLSLITTSPYDQPDLSYFIDSYNNPNFAIDGSARFYYRVGSETTIASGNWNTSSGFGTAASTYYTWHFTLNPRAPDITDVDGDETWNDGDTGLVITGTGLAT